MDMDAVNVQLIAGIAVVVLILAIAAWLIFSRSRKGSAHGASAATAARQSADDRAALVRENTGLREQYGLLSERLDRYERTHTELREELARIREDATVRTDRIGPLEKLQRELQEQIFELREEHKVLMQRDDRHERTVQELQAELNRLRPGIGADSPRS